MIDGCWLKELCSVYWHKPTVSILRLGAERNLAIRPGSPTELLCRWCLKAVTASWGRCKWQHSKMTIITAQLRGEDPLFRN
jgi:hypothetical protein